MHKKYNGPERRQFVRLKYNSPLSYKICSKETVSKLLDGYVSDVSQSGVACSVKEKVRKDDILWLCFDRSTLIFCGELDKNALIYQNGIIGKVAHVQHNNSGNYDLGIQFITREEKNSTHIYPKIHFIEQKLKIC